MDYIKEIVDRSLRENDIRYPATTDEAKRYQEFIKWSQSQTEQCLDSDFYETVFFRIQDLTSDTIGMKSNNSKKALANSKIQLICMVACLINLALPIDSLDTESLLTLSHFLLLYKPNPDVLREEFSVLGNAEVLAEVNVIGKTLEERTTILEKLDDLNDEYISDPTNQEEVTGFQNYVIERVLPTIKKENKTHEGRRI